MGIDNIDILKEPGSILDMENYIRSRQKKGKTQKEIAIDLRAAGYDNFSIQALILKHWDFGDEGA